MGKNIFCAECGQENEKEYEYCKNCGARLKKEETLTGELTGEPAGATGAFSGADGAVYGAGFEGIDGIPADEIALFVGKKSPLFLRKFSGMQLSSSKVSWCWPVAVLGFLFGPFGAAFWFFYRKMYKKAFILSAIGAVATILLTVLGGEAEVTLGALDSAIYDGGFLINDIIGMSGGWRAVAAQLIESIVNISTAVLLGIFSMSIYKNFIVSKIKEYRTKNADPRYYRLGLSVIGGTSGGMVWVGILLYFLAVTLGSALVEVINIL